jgi:alkylation response protein AidB-like acyl-CoA dehydrogenase
MDFSIPPALAATLARVDELMATHVLPLEQAVLTSGFAASAAALEAARAEVRAAGLWGAAPAASLGGLGLSLVEHGLVSEQLGRSPARPLRLRLPGARRRQHGDPARPRHPGAAASAGSSRSRAASCARASR